MIEQTFIIIKPDAIRRGLVGKIISRFEDMGLAIERIEERCKNESWCHQHYCKINDESIYNHIRAFMVNYPLIGIVLIGDNAVERVRKRIGSTNALQAAPGTIRGDWGKYGGPFNLVHASDSLKNSNREIELYFNRETDQ